MFCPNCGNKINDGESFCGKCGTNINEFLKKSGNISDTQQPDYFNQPDQYQDNSQNIDFDGQNFNSYYDRNTGYNEQTYNGYYDQNAGYNEQAYNGYYDQNAGYNEQAYNGYYDQNAGYNEQAYNNYCDQNAGYNEQAYNDYYDQGTNYYTDDGSKKKSGGAKKFIIILLVILIIGGAAGGTWWFISNHGDKDGDDVINDSSSSSSSAQSTSVPTTVDDTTRESTTAGYTEPDEIDSNTVSPVIVSAKTMVGSELGASNVDSSRDFKAENTIDDNVESCWCVNTNSEGAAGAQIKFELKEKATVSRIAIINGNQYHTENGLYELNGQLKTFTLTFSDGSRQTFTAEFNDGNEHGYQYIDLDYPVETEYIILTVDSSFVGTKFSSNTCLTEFKVF